MIDIIGTELNQWDTGRSVRVTGIDATKVHFANQGDSKAPIMDLVNSEAKIPDYLLQTGKQLCVYAVANGVTIERRVFSVKKRERPESYVYEEDQRNFIYTLITDAENAIAEASAAADKAKNAANDADLATHDAAQAELGATQAAERANDAADKANKAATNAAHTAKSLMVIGEGEGTAIALDDAIDQYLVGLRVFGKTTQDGTPTPDSPVELVSVGDGGVTNTTVCGVNLVPGLIEGKTYTRNGMTLKVYADRCVCSGTPTGAYAQVYIAHLTDTLPNGVYRVDGGQNDIGKVYLQVLVKRNGKTNYYIQDKTFQIYGDEDEITVTIQSGASTEAITNYVFYPILHVGSMPIAYEPYQGQTLTISTPGGLPGIPVTSSGNYTDANGQQWICDEIDLKRGVRIQRVGVLTTDNLTAKTFELNNGTNSATYNQYTAYGAFPSIAYPKGPASTIDNLKALCNVFPLGQQITHDVVQEAIWIHSNTVLAFVLNKSTCPDAASAKEYILKSGLVLYYALENPIETPLSEEELAAYSALHTYKDRTTVSNDAGAWMDLEYVMDAKKYINSLVISGGGSIIPATVE